MKSSSSSGSQLSRLRRKIESSLQVIESSFGRSHDVARLFAEMTEMADGLIGEIFRQPAGTTRLSVIALAGYGRRSLYPASDLDLLILTDSPVDPEADPSSEREVREAIQGLLQTLWDCGFRVGQQVWSWNQLQSLQESDFEFVVALLDARHVAGDNALTRQLLEEFLPEFVSTHQAAVAEWLTEATRQRHRRFRNTIYQLEPDVKESPGGLRDYHVTRWLAQLGQQDPFVPYSAAQIDAAFLFVSTLRILLHYHFGRDRNQLTHKLQEGVAQQLGYHGGSKRSAVESLMKEYFLHAKVLATNCRRAVDKVRGAPGDAIRISEFSPVEGVQDALQVFLRSAVEARPLSDDVRNVLAGALGRLVTSLSYPELAELVLQIWQPRRGLYRVLEEMYQLGYLELLFPEFGSIKARVIRDFYHRYTVDEHSLLAIKAVENLAGDDLEQEKGEGSDEPDSRFTELLRETDEGAVLTLALLLHDVGKSRGGKHVDTGARMAAQALRRFRFSQQVTDTVIFLIRNHLAMSSVMQRRNIEDVQEVSRFADLVGSVRLLRLLCLLTYADITAVAPGTLNRWKRDRLFQLYVATYHQLTVAYGEERIHEAELEDALLSQLPEDIEVEAFEDFLEGFPRRYVRTTPPSEIFQHYRLGSQLSSQRPVQVRLVHRDSHWECCVVTADRHGMFSRIAGLLSYFQMNILRGYAFSNRRDTVLDFFQFDDTGRTFELNPTEQDRFRELLIAAIAGDIEVEELLARKEGSLIFRPHSEPMDPVIYFGSDSAKEYSILEIVASDSIGLLYRISRAITEGGCNIELVLISTEGDKAVDVFYLTHNGARLDEDLRDRLNDEIRRAIRVME